MVWWQWLLTRLCRYFFIHRTQIIFIRHVLNLGFFTLWVFYPMILVRLFRAATACRSKRISWVARRRWPSGLVGGPAIRDECPDQDLGIMRGHWSQSTPGSRRLWFEFQSTPSLRNIFRTELANNVQSPLPILVIRLRCCGYGRGSRPNRVARLITWLCHYWNDLVDWDSVDYWVEV